MHARFYCRRAANLVTQSLHFVNFRNVAARKVRQLHDLRTRHAVHLILAPHCSKIGVQTMQKEINDNTACTILAFIGQTLEWDTSKASIKAIANNSKLDHVDIFLSNMLTM